MILPIKLHTREGLMQLWSGVQLFPKQLQLEIKREIDRRNRLRQLGKPFTLAILLLYFNVSIGQRTIDTNERYEWEQFQMGETDDCAVRAVASTGYSYYDAHAMLKFAGREDCKGISLRVYIKALAPTGRLLDMITFDRVYYARSFIDKFEQKGYSYLVFNRYHTFLIKDGTVYGNEGDRDTPIIGYLKLANGSKPRF